jgi:hypothetical protein
VKIGNQYICFNENRFSVPYIFDRLIHLCYKSKAELQYVSWEIGVNVIDRYNVYTLKDPANLLTFYLVKWCYVF